MQYLSLFFLFVVTVVAVTVGFTYFVVMIPHLGVLAGVLPVVAVQGIWCAHIVSWKSLAAIALGGTELVGSLGRGRSQYSSHE